MKWIKRGIIAGMISSVAWFGMLLAWIRPSLKQLLSFRFWMEFPLKVMFKSLATIFPLASQIFGENGTRAMQYVLYEAGRARGKLMLEALQIDPNDARSIGRVIDFEDGVGGVKGKWVDQTKGMATKEELYCPATKELESCPEVCTCLMMAMEAGTFAGWAPRITMPKFDKLLSVGDDCCRATLKLKPVPGSEETDKEISPHANYDFPPKISMPPTVALQMAMLMGMGAMKGVLKILTSGPNQPMEWYDDFRYMPGEAYTKSGKK
ncbi:MAG: hypothetical protein JW738_10370 [Actinobacteria bacterium]|nr:hypothetical protein [Actinomycetota bacterium]